MTELHLSIKNFIIQGKIEDAVKELLKIEDKLPRHLKRNLIHISSSLVNIEQQYRRGLLKSDEYQLQRNKITDNILQLIEELESEANNSRRKKNLTNVKKKYILLFSIVIILFAISVNSLLVRSIVGTFFSGNTPYIYNKQLLESTINDLSNYISKSYSTLTLNNEEICTWTASQMIYGLELTNSAIDTSKYLALLNTLENNNDGSWFFKYLK
ncbi:MAG: hypothetical protein AAFP82_00540 [Bacteroidota bacterium]